MEICEVEPPPVPGWLEGLAFASDFLFFNVVLPLHEVILRLFFYFGFTAGTLSLSPFLPCYRRNAAVMALIMAIKGILQTWERHAVCYHGKLHDR